MDNQLSQPPTMTRWQVELTHGLVDTLHGPRGGWGWVCSTGHAPYGEHGYTTDLEALIGLRVHMGACPGV